MVHLLLGKDLHSVSDTLLPRRPALPTQLAAQVIPTPLGPATLWASERGLVRLEFDTSDDAVQESSRNPRLLGHLDGGRQWLARYFGRQSPGPLPQLAPTGSPFQRTVWNVLLQIAPGQTRSYGELARMLRNPGAARAVGGACGANPLPVFIPCHRVLAQSGKLGGFSCGPHRKRWLLWHEGHAPSA